MRKINPWDNICEVHINGEKFLVDDLEVTLDVDQNVMHGPHGNHPTVTDQYVTLKLIGEMYEKKNG